MSASEEPVSIPNVKRRRVLEACVGLALATRARGDDSEPAVAPPRENDLLVFAYGRRAGELITPDDLVPDARQVLAWPMDPATRAVRDGTRLNQLAVVRLDPELLAPETLQRSAAGVVAYSAVCTHTGCEITDWYRDVLRFKCPCHESEFDPKDGARVIGGPAPLPLAALPLKLADGALAVAAPFIGRVGFMEQPGLEPFRP